MICKEDATSGFTNNFRVLRGRDGGRSTWHGFLDMLGGEPECGGSPGLCCGFCREAYAANKGFPPFHSPFGKIGLRFERSAFCDRWNRKLCPDISEPLQDSANCLPCRRLQTGITFNRRPTAQETLEDRNVVATYGPRVGGIPQS